MQSVATSHTGKQLTLPKGPWLPLSLLQANLAQSQKGQPLS